MYIKLRRMLLWFASWLQHWPTLSFARYIRIEGSTPGDTRQALVDEYQQRSEVRVAVLSITAASTGITLTAANLVVFAELYWNPGVSASVVIILITKVQLFLSVW